VKVFNNLEEILCKISILKNYESKHELDVQSDLSEKVLGCCILQKKCSINNAKCLSDIEIS